MYKCKICGKKYTELTALYNHIESKHKEMIPKDMSVQQYYYYMKTGKMNGNCVMCKQPTSWNSNTGKYNRFCGNPRCKDEYVKIMKSRMVAKYGKTHLLNDPNKQREMLANRSISGVYKWSDGKHETTYTGSYELDFLKTLDGFFDWDPEDISMPSPHTYTYKYEGEDKFYIPDVFIHSLDLEIEIKDGGDNPNNHYKIQAVDKQKEALKDEVMCSQKAFHYIKITNKNYENFFNFLKEIKKAFEKYEDDSKIPRIFKIEDIKGIGAIKESVEIVEEGLIDKTINLFTGLGKNKSHRELDHIISINYDLVKNNPEELKNFLQRLAKTVHTKDDIEYVRQLNKKSRDHCQKMMKRMPETKDPYKNHYDWIINGGVEKDFKKIKEGYEYIDESYFRRKKDLYVNFELFDSGKSNICLITGLSGSGKSTLSDEICKKYNAKCIEMDVFEHPDMQPGNLSHKYIYNDYFKNKPDLRMKLVNNDLSNHELSMEMSNALSYILNYCNEHPKEKFVIEGLQIFADINPDYIKGKPIVFVNTSMINSMIRKVKRDKYKYKVMDLFEWYIADEKKFEGFKNELIESYIIDRMEESSISIPQMSMYLQNEYEEEMRNYLNTYKKYYNLMLKEQPSAVEHINEDIRKCLIVIDGLAEKGVENNLVQFAKDDLGEIVKASKKGKPVKVYEMVEDSVNIDDSTNDINSITVQGDNVSISNIVECKIVYNINSNQLFTLRDIESKLIIEESYVVQRDKIGTHCSVKPYYQDIEMENVIEFTLLLDKNININDLSKLNNGVNIANLYKIDDNKYNFIKESCLKLFGVYPKEIKIK